MCLRTAILLLLLCVSVRGQALYELLLLSGAAAPGTNYPGSSDTNFPSFQFVSVPSFHVIGGKGVYDSAGVLIARDDITTPIGSWQDYVGTNHLYTNNTLGGSQPVQTAAIFTNLAGTSSFIGVNHTDRCRLTNDYVPLGTTGWTAFVVVRFNDFRAPLSGPIFSVYTNGGNVRYQAYVDSSKVWHFLPEATGLTAESNTTYVVSLRVPVAAGTTNTFMVNTNVYSNASSDTPTGINRLHFADVGSTDFGLMTRECAIFDYLLSDAQLVYMQTNFMNAYGAQ